MAAMTMALAMSPGLDGAGTAAQAQAEKTKELSEKTVKTLMRLAWQVLPNQFTTPTGKKIEVDKKNPDAALIPVDLAREVIMIGHDSGHAQLCQMWEEQLANYNTLMRREVGRKNDKGQGKWTEPQLLYITTLHRMTIHLAAGKLRVEDKNGEQHVFLEPIDVTKGDACPDERRKRVRESILEFLKRNGTSVAAGAVPVPGLAPARPVSQPGAPQPPKK